MGRRAGTLADAARRKRSCQAVFHRRIINNPYCGCRPTAHTHAFEPSLKQPMIPNKTSLLEPARNVHRCNTGWIVRFMRHGQTHQKYFADQIHGGPDNALKAANAYRHQWQQEFAATALLDPPARRKKEERLALRPAKSLARQPGPSGVFGVTRVVSRTPQGREFSYWEAERPSGLDIGPRRYRFAIKRYGEAEAMALAIEARRAMQVLAESGADASKAAMRRQHLQVMMDESLAADFESLAQARGVSCGALVVQLIMAELTRCKRTAASEISRVMGRSSDKTSKKAASPRAPRSP